MSFQSEQPFHERESRYFLAEILKTSDVPLADLVKTIQERNVVPQWEQMALPMGRSIASCRHQFGLLTNRVSSMLLQPPPAQPLQPPPPQQQHYGRLAQTRAPLSQPPGMTGEPMYQTQQQYQFAPINEPGHPPAFHTAPYNPVETTDKTGKKRGRPSKQERELREAEARSRGEVYQPTKRRKPKDRPSTEGGEAGAEGEAGVPKKKARVSDLEPEVVGPSPGPYLGTASQLRTSPPDQMQLDTPERQGASVGMTGEVPESPALRNLLEGAQEQATRPEALQSAFQVSSAPAIEAAAPGSATLPQAPTQEKAPTTERSERAATSSRDSREAPEARMA